MQSGLMRSLAGTSAKFAKPKLPLSGKRKTAILVSIIPIVFYDWAIGPIIDPILRLITAIGCAWYAVGIIYIVAFAMRFIPASWKAWPLVGVITITIWLMVISRIFTIAIMIADWMAQLLQNQGYLSGGVVPLIFLMGFICFPVLPLMWFLGEVPPSSA